MDIEDLIQDVAKAQAAKVSGEAAPGGDQTETTPETVEAAAAELATAQADLVTAQESLAAAEASVLALTGEKESLQTQLEAEKASASVLLTPVRALVKRMAILAGQTLDVDAMASAELSAKYTELQPLMAKIPTTQVSKSTQTTAAAPAAGALTPEQERNVKAASQLKIGSY